MTLVVDIETLSVSSRKAVRWSASPTDIFSAEAGRAARPATPFTCRHIVDGDEVADELASAVLTSGIELVLPCRRQVPSAQLG